MSAESDAATDAPTAQAHAPPASIDETPITQLSDRQMDRLGREDNAVLRTRFLAHFDFGAVPVVAALRQFLAAVMLRCEVPSLANTVYMAHRDMTVPTNRRDTGNGPHAPGDCHALRRV